MNDKKIKIGGAAGFWGETDTAMSQFYAEGDLDYIAFDYLAEITMSILAGAPVSDPTLGYATDFVSAMVKPNLQRIADSGVKLISNAGGVNPKACGNALRDVIAAEGLDLKVVVVTGDDLLDQLNAIASSGAEMFSGEAFPPIDKVASANAYIGAFPIAAALATSAHIVVAGRCVDSAGTLGTCIHEFGRSANELDKLSAGSAIGHSIECSPQATAGNFADWEAVADSLHNVGYPIPEVSPDGSCDIYKPKDTSGIVNCGTVAEQLLYEISDPAAYILPNVVCDFTQINLEQVADNRVRGFGARERGVLSTDKTSIMWADGWRAGTTFWCIGRRAADKARIFAEEALMRTRKKIRAMGGQDFDDVAIDVIGEESFLGFAYICGQQP